MLSTQKQKKTTTLTLIAINHRFKVSKCYYRLKQKSSDENSILCFFFCKNHERRASFDYEEKM
jgi:hypothetical protein